MSHPWPCRFPVGVLLSALVATGCDSKIQFPEGQEEATRYKPTPHGRVPTDEVPSDTSSPGEVDEPTGEPDPEPLPEPELPDPVRGTMVVPLDWSKLPAAAPNDADTTRLLGILRNANRFAMTTWWKTTKNYDAQATTYLTFAAPIEGNVRAAAAIAVTLALSLKLKAFDPASSGVSEATARARAFKLIASIAKAHVINTAGGWGNTGQSTISIGHAALAAWILWEELPTADAELVRRMVTSEASRLVGPKTAVLRSPSGALSTPLADTTNNPGYANGFNALLLSLAANMMPVHPQMEAWQHESIRQMVSGLSRPRDLTALETLVNGRPFSHWVAGSNLNDDGTMISRNRIHPDYAVTTASNIAMSGLLFRLRGKEVPEASRKNAAEVYASLVDRSFPVGSTVPPLTQTAAAPGGTVYRRDLVGAPLPTLYYPHGDNWGTRRVILFVLLDVLARHEGLDAQATIKASLWEGLHATAVAQMQSRFDDGHMFANTAENAYDGGEELAAFHAAFSYLVKYLSGMPASVPSSKLYPLVVDNADAAFSVVKGTWASATSAGRLAASVLTRAAVSTGTDSVLWKPTLPAGTFRVYAWWPSAGATATEAKYSVTFEGGQADITANQTQNGGKWNLLGEWAFAKGAAGSVSLTNAAKEGTVAADGVMFVAQ
jgi:hypothetical protein